MQQLQTLRIERGIGQFNANDHYAVLGLPVTANTTQIRKRYLSIAKRLHPDIYGLPPEEKWKACQYFSKLVCPAYNLLMQERERAEYCAILKLLAKRLMKRSQVILPQSEVAKQLLYLPTDTNYEQLVQAIAEEQYKSLDAVGEYTSQLSELNLVYVLAKEGYKPLTASMSNPVSDGMRGANGSVSPITTSAKCSPTTAQTPLNHQRASQDNATEQAQHVRAAEEFIRNKQWALALKELRTILQFDNNNSKYHAMLGFVYMNQNLTSMAKVSFQQALNLNPKEPLALQCIHKVGGTSTHKENKKGGFFGWLGNS